MFKTEPLSQNTEIQLPGTPTTIIPPFIPDVGQTEEVSSFEVEDLLSHDAPSPNESADSSASPSVVIRISLSLLKDRLS